MKYLKPFLMLAFMPVAGISQEIEDIETDRPDQTECSSVIPRKTIQVETGLVRELDTNTSTLFIPTTLIRIGTFKRLEFRVIAGEYFATRFIDSARSHIDKGFSPFSFGAKTFICKEAKFIPQTSLIFHLNHENSSFSFTKLSYDFRFSMSHTLSKRTDLGYNLGGEWNPDTKAFSWIYTLTTAYSFTDKLGAYIELFGTISRKQLPIHQFDGGATFLVQKNLQLDCSAGIALNENSTDSFLSAGFSWRIPK